MCSFAVTIINVVGGSEFNLKNPLPICLVEFESGFDREGKEEKLTNCMLLLSVFTEIMIFLAVAIPIFVIDILSSDVC